ncbi:MAG: hypothetical protein EBR32_02085 [Bacteroidetes bacterium]|nr:hypothetical protein [Bacteroidota bacterium]
MPSKRVIKRNKNRFINPLLDRIHHESEREYKDLQEAFELMGWGQLPDSLKIEIYDDVKAIVKELQGSYSSCDPYVKNRRNRVYYWVQSFLDGVSSLETTIEVLKIPSL